MRCLATKNAPSSPPPSIMTPPPCSRCKPSLASARFSARGMARVQPRPSSASGIESAHMHATDGSFLRVAESPTPSPGQTPSRLRIYMGPYPCARCRTRPGAHQTAALRDRTRSRGASELAIARRMLDHLHVVRVEHDRRQLVGDTAG
jgi:hypothetical protein